MSQRITSDHSRDEFDRLISNINDMLSRQESLITGVRRVSDNIAHDIRTPLTKLFTSLEYHKRNSKNEEFTAELDSSLSDITHLLTVLQSILKISQLEAGGRRSKFEKIDLNPILMDLEEFYEPLAESQSIKIAVDLKGSLAVRGDRDLLFQAFSNIIDNAIKFSPGNALIRIEAITKNRQVCVTVTDEGPGIPHEFRGKVFERFYRIEESRNVSGYGLGLSLVKTAVDIHSGKISINDCEKGLSIELRFPEFTEI